MFSYCLNTSTIHTTPLLEKIRLAGKHGFAAIELWLVDVERFMEDGGTLDDIAGALNDAGLTVKSVIALKGWADAPPTAWPAVRDEICGKMALAARLGAPYIVATPPRDEVPLAAVADRYRELLALGRREGILPAMEYLGFSQSMWQVGQAWTIVMAAEDPQATLVLDTFHTFRGGSSVADLARIEGGRVAIYHVNDAPRTPPRDEQTDADRVLPGDGHLDIAGQLSLATRNGYAGPVSLELFNRALWEEDPDKVVALGIQRLRQVLDRVSESE